MPLTTNIKYDQLKNVLKVDLIGSLDGSNANEFDIKLKNEFSKEIKLLIFDMKELSYISSAGIRSVILGLKQVKAQGGKMALANRQPQIVKVFEIMLSLPDLKIFANQKELDSYLDKMQKKMTN